MKQRIMVSAIAAAFMTTGAIANDALLERFEKMEREMAALKAELNALKNENTKLSSQLSAPSADSSKTAVASSSKLDETLEEMQDQIDDLNKKSNNNNLKWGVDFRTSVDNLRYKMADGTTRKNDALFSNRLWLNMSYAANENISFTGQLAYNKIFGERSMASSSAPFEGFDWVSNESAYNDELRVRSAYFLYNDDEFFGADVPWTFSIGRRPSTEGHLINLRDDVDASSPLAHAVNVEFDGASAKFGMEEISGLDGSYFKLCAGRGMSNAEPRFAKAPYSGEDALTNNNDMIGIIVVPYDDKQYSTGLQYTYATNLIDTVTPVSTNMEAVGALHTATAFAMVSGIGEGISDFLDDTTVFISGAMSKTDPDAGKQGMLGSNDGKTGYSYWIGTQFPSLISDEGRWGIEFNHGSNYWRPITYGEDTMIGSKIAARGDAYEVYFTEPLVDDILTFQLRYTYIDYDYTGSNGFFGSSSGTPTAIGDVSSGTDAVSKAQDIRAYLRYKF
ncbi:MAG: hypothetical protein JU82_10745 [Sulfuricurvum sp. MLSB]|uniref:DUF3373 family protein n=2 Tax=unclassified Sulfuricurvum TaxID=2632390 RepID=UPI0005019958|nr:DUF3373 family protein [Sulfuricurvum sp. MLSB]KFN38595.1 MAG: hypothetical protein JU82_10745 [Sulfuricurvum sp. MLSB]